MAAQAFLRTILDDPDDDLPRLAFADWLEEHDQPDRAAWVRASVRRGHLRHDDPGFREAVGAEAEAFRRCRPVWWRDVTGVTQTNDRGLIRFEARSKAAVTQLGKAAWLGDGLAGGWLEGVRVYRCDGPMIRVVAGWPDPVRQVPLFVEPVPQTGDAFVPVLAVPHLWGLKLPAAVASNPAVRAGLGRRADLRDLHLDQFHLVDDPAGLLRELGTLSGLRRLTIAGYTRPTDGDLAALGGLAGLRELTLDRSLAVTDAGLAAVAALPGLRRLKLWNCPNLTDGGRAGVRPGVAVERL